MDDLELFGAPRAWFWLVVSGTAFVYAGLAIFLLGSAVTTLSPACALITVGGVAPLFLRRAKYEESLLEQEFGDAYREYATRLHWRRFVPTFVPFGW